MFKTILRLRISKYYYLEIVISSFLKKNKKHTRNQPSIRFPEYFYSTGM